MGALDDVPGFARGDLHVGRRLPHQIMDHRPFVFDVLFLLAFLHFEERRLGNIDVTLLDQLRHLPEEEREQERANVRAVDVRIGHQDDAMITKLRQVEIFFPDAGAQRHDQRFDFVMREHLVKARFFHVENLALERQDRLVLTIAALLG